MTAENNRKYIAEAWIDDGTEEEMKKSFLKSLIEQMQGHLNGFDSDTVDGMHWEEVDGDDGIKDYIDKKGDGEFRLPLVLAQASPIFHSSCEGKLGIALE